MQNLEQFESTENLSDMLWELSWLAKEIWSNEGTLGVVKKELDANPDHMTDTTACVWTSSLDKVYANKKKFNKLSPENKDTLELIVNNRRGEVLAENYNQDYNNCRQKVRYLVDAVQQIS